MNLNTFDLINTSHDHVAFQLEAYRRMALIRSFEAKCLELSNMTPQLVAGSIHLCAGQEAISVGARAALRPTDQVVATYRGHGWALESGITVRELLFEVAHRKDGINGGRAGSAMVMAPERGFAGENSIVGAGGPIAVGIGLACSRRGADGVVLVSFGDGAMSQGALHESLVFAAAQKLPVIFLCENNGWAEMTATSTTTRVEDLSSRARGYGITGTTIDGNDPVTVRDAVQEAVTQARSGEGPTLIECKTFRLWGHYNRDIEHYRDKKDKERAEVNDPLLRLERLLIEQSASSPESLSETRRLVDVEINALAEELLTATLPDPESALAHVYSTSSASQALETQVSLPESPQEMAFWQAINAALRTELSANTDVLVYGEDVGYAGGIFGVTRRLQKEFGESRVFDTPIAESAILGSAVGAAIVGMRPIVEIMWTDFMLVALDQLINQAANVRYITQGRASVPMVVRMQQGSTPGSCAQHSQCLEALLFHIPGLRIAMPTTPQDAYDLLRAAVADPDPTIIIEARGLYQTRGTVSEHFSLRRAQGAVRRRDGKDVALISWGTALPLMLEAAEQLQVDGIEASVLDLRWLSPLDDAAIDSVVKESDGYVLVVHEANVTGGVGAEIAARISARNWSVLKAPVHRIGAKDVRIPASPQLRQAVLPSVDEIVCTAKAMRAKEKL